jgi:peptidoglycan/LPS O-acetylase OafA/YrhL
MGVRTYGIFLGHFIVMIGLQNFDFFINLQSNEGVLGQLLFFLMVVIGATGIGYVSYRFIEKPIILFSNKKFRFTS